MKRLSSTLLAALLLAAVGCAGAVHTASAQSSGNAPRDSARADTTHADSASTDTTRNAEASDKQQQQQQRAPRFGDVQALLQDTFVPLMTKDDELSASSWQAFVRGSEHGPVVIPYDARHSLLMEVARHARAEGREGAPTQEEMARMRRWIEAGAPSDDGAVPYAEAQNRLYVANEAGALVTIVDTDSNRVVGTVDLTEHGFSENAKPHDTAVEPGGEHWYVSLIGAGRVLKLNRDNEIVGQAEMEAPGLMTLVPGSGRLFVGRSMGAVNPPKSVAIVDRETMSAELVDIFFPRPHAIAVDSAGRHAYVASLARNQVAGIDAETGAVELTSMGGPINTLVHFAIGPDGRALAAGGQVSGKLFFFDVAEETPLTPQPTDSLQLGGQPWLPSYTPDGSQLYVPQKTAGAVAVIDAAARTVSATISGRGLDQPHGSAVRPDGRYAYVSGSNVEGTYEHRYPGIFGDENRGTIVVIDTRSNEIVKVLDADQDPSGMSVRPAS